jgi:hypothetical protein
MPFQSYEATATNNGEWLLQNPLLLLFSGNNGIIARYLRASLPMPENQCWTLLEDDIQDLMDPAPPPPGPPAARHRWMIFAQNENGGLRLRRVERIRGLSDRQTELLITLSPLILKSLSTDRTRCVVQQPPNARQWSEELALDGGVSNLSGPWTWCARELNIGAAVVGRK